MQKVQLIDVESSKRNAALPLHLACRGKLTDADHVLNQMQGKLHLACRGKLTDCIIHSAFMCKSQLIDELG